MTKRNRRVMGLLLALLLAVQLTAPAAAANIGKLDAAVNAGAAYLLNTVTAPAIRAVGGEWTVIGLARSGCEVPQRYWDDYYAAVEREVRASDGLLHARKYTEHSRVILALTAIGADPTNVAGYDLLLPLGDFDQTVWQGVNGPIWALIALDSGGYEIPVHPTAATQATRQLYVKEILDCQLPDGGWSLSGTAPSDPDVTGMALQALANYRTQSAVRAAVDKALALLSRQQNADGGYSSGSAANTESAVQVLVALCALGISTEDSRFVKNGRSLTDYLLQCQNADGSFFHTAGSGQTLMTSEQGFYGLVAALRQQNRQTFLYEMSDAKPLLSGSGAADARHPDLHPAAVTSPGVTFPDIANHPDRTAIEALAARGIVGGFTSERFGPNDTMTRAQFAAVMVRGLGLPRQAAQPFTDVAADSWCEPYVGSAHAYGIVNGKTAATFDPSGTITRQQAAAMVARAAALCGLTTSLTDQQIRNALAPFADQQSIGTWARESMAFCCREGILDDSGLYVEPHRPILRCEIAQMLYQLLERADLL